ncbi:hypothetical protein [Sphingosinicella sp.]|uniref:hypothetical protein n=1 Tax=Sphingosinicella sp. TaxID=1917971 RepID=UPI0017CE491F|nr:hypothetical protein [Sphingosinicella sp.]MBA4759662.1 hypothetical protein [Sphingosinicella sp.]
MRGRLAVSVLKNAVLAVLPFWIVFILTKILSDGPDYDHQGFHLTIAALVFLLPLLWGAVFGVFVDENLERLRSKKCYDYHDYWYYFFVSILFYFAHWAFRESCDYGFVAMQMHSAIDYSNTCAPRFFSFAIVCQVPTFFLTLRGARSSLERAYNAD